MDLTRTLLLATSLTWAGHLVCRGTPPRELLVVGAVTLLPTLLVWWWHAALGPIARAAWCAAPLVVVLADAGVHLTRLADPGPTDVTGLLAGAVASAFLVVVVTAAVRGARTVRRRVVGALVAAACLPAWVLPLAGAVVQTHPLPERPPDRPDRSYVDVTFHTGDGVEISGWYRPSVNGAAVVLVPSASGTRRSTLAHARLLADHGYGVLLFDARGSGASTGPRNAYGWGWEVDVRAAVAYVASRPDVDRQRVGALGLSTGADVLVEMASDPGSGLAAVVADGATARSASDLKPLGSPIGTWPLRATFSGMQLLSGTTPGPPLERLAARIENPALFVAAGSIPQEIPLGEAYARAAHGEIWTLPDVTHTRALVERPDEYERRVVGFLHATLL